VRGGGAERRAPVARHRRNATVSSASLRFPRGGEARHRARRCTQVRRRRRLQLRPSIVPFPADARRRLPPAAFPPSALPRPPPPPPLPLLLGSAVARRLPRFGLRRFGLRRFGHRRFCRRPGSPVRKFVALANGLRDGRNVLGPAHSGFMWCMTWSMAAMPNGHDQLWRQRRRRRQARHGPARELKNVCCPSGVGLQS